MTDLTEEHRATVERVLEIETTPAYQDAGYYLYPAEIGHYVDRGDNSCPELMPLKDVELVSAAPLLKAAILEQREEIESLKGEIDAQKRYSSFQLFEIYRLTEEINNARRVNNDD
jgi:hypothetical protein